jgi:preprotein translocase subunit SecB
MSETTTPPAAPGAGQMPPLLVNIQYVKDMSFEVPNAPQIFAQLRSQPVVNVNIDVQARRLHPEQNAFEVTLMIKTEALEGPATAQTGSPADNGQQHTTVPVTPPAPSSSSPPLFMAELAYAGVFTLTGLPDNAIEPVLLVECPRLLFPFARNILADITREGGFPPVLLQPVDFVALWQRRRAAQEAQPAVTN